MCDLPGISYIRTTREATPALYGSDEDFPIGGSKTLRSTDGDVATLVDALRAVVSSPDLRARLGARSRALYLERYEAGAVAARMEALYAEVIRVHAERPAPRLTAAGTLLAAEGGRAARAETHLAAVTASRSWRWTGPLRGLARRARR